MIALSWFENAFTVKILKYNLNKQHHMFLETARNSKIKNEDTLAKFSQDKMRHLACLNVKC